MKRDFHFIHENSIPVFKKKKPKNPAPPMNAKRNPSTAIQDYSEYDEAQPERKADREEPVVINEPEEFSDEDIKVYEPKRSKKKPPAEPGSKKETNRFLLAAIIMGAVGVMLLIVGVVIAVNYYNMYY